MVFFSILYGIERFLYSKLCSQILHEADKWMTAGLKLFGRLLKKTFKRFRKPIILSSVILLFIAGLDWEPTKQVFTAILELGIILLGFRIVFFHRIFPKKKSHRK